jgi:hypothetical protein
MRFLFNFFFFGILFYLIWMFFPDAFMTLVNWANHVVAFFRDLIMGLSDKMQHQVQTPTPTPAPNPSAAWLILPFIRR